MTKMLTAAFAAANLEITKFDDTKKKKVFTASDGAMTVEDFSEMFRKRLGKKFKDHVDAVDLSLETGDFHAALVEIAKERKIYVRPKERTVDAEMGKYTLNVDMSSDPVKFFVTRDELLSRMTGASFLAAMYMKQDEAMTIARKVIREYDPFGAVGMRQVQTRNEILNFYNIYVPPPWKEHPNFKVKDPTIPKLFHKVLTHTLPDKKERGYFYAWLYMSLFKRAPTYLVLNAGPGIGKNRLKLLMRALHGHANSPDGKRSMISEKFNSQIENSTLLFFDELKYDQDTENTMKELTNNTTSIERKGIDPTNSTRIFCSLAIANNYPRDNYIQFDSRKFVPLLLNPLPLTESMSPAEIEKFNEMVEFEDSKTFDVGAIAQFAKWLKRYGPGFAAKFPNMEYKGPRFYYLAHTSMSKWENAIVSYFYTDNHRFGIDGEHKEGYLWSAIESKIKRGHGLHRGYAWPHIENIRRFVMIYRDLQGKEAFEVTPASTSVMGDFYIKPIRKKIKTLSEEDAELL